MIRRIIGALVGLLAISLLFSHAITDWQWFASLGYLPLMVTPWLWRLAVGAGAGLLSLVVLYTNLLAARPVLARAYLRPDLPRPLSRRSWQWVRRWSALLVVGLAAALGVSAASRWMDVALFFHRRPFGIEDPVFGRDVAFYVFALPAVQLVTSTLLAAVLLAGVLSLLVYALAGLLDWRHKGEGLAGRPRLHLMLLLAMLALLWGVESWLARYDLLFSPRGVFFGASYA
ncbi:MAG: COG1615 family transporter, partial [Firmicutes bacterium]|nr:COG1615 family transporter [Bacillota bacterium]